MPRIAKVTNVDLVTHHLFCVCSFAKLLIGHLQQGLSPACFRRQAHCCCIQEVRPSKTYGSSTFKEILAASHCPWVGKVVIERSLVCESLQETPLISEVIPLQDLLNGPFAVNWVVS